MVVVVLGVDVSHHQEGIDWAAWAKYGIQFAMLKCTEGSTFKDSRFTYNLVNARKNGILVAAYHYQKSGVTAAAQVENVLSMVPKNCPVIPDVELNSGSVALTRDIVARLRKAGYQVPFTYIPKWYWHQIGEPNLAGLPPLWSSRYPDNIVQDIVREYADVEHDHPNFWDGYGNLPVSLLQFTSSARVAGRSKIDGNAFRGTKAQLIALLGGKAVDDMPTVAEIYNAPIPRVGSVLGGNTTLKSLLANADKIIEQGRARDAALLGAIKALSSNPDLTPAKLQAIMDQAADKAMPTAEEIAVAQKAIIEEIVRDVIPQEQANMIIQKLGEALAKRSEEPA
jgi:GH25 family lysozyme M1 (1,4-beta-N-acetylmuramidase)